MATPHNRSRPGHNSQNHATPQRRRRVRQWDRRNRRWSWIWR